MDQNNSFNPAFTFATAAPLPQGNSDEFIPHPGMYMGQMPWPVYFPQVPQPNDTAQFSDAAPFNDASASKHSEGPAGARAHVPVASPSVAGAGNASNSYQAVQPPFSVVNIGNATYNQAFLNPYPPQPGVAIPPQYQFMPAHQYDQASFPSGAFAGAMQPQISGVAIPPQYQSMPAHQYDQASIPSGAMQPQIYGVPSHTHFPIQNTHLQQFGGGLVSTSSLPPQATVSSTGRKRGAKGFEDREETKKVKLQPEILGDPDFEPTSQKDAKGHQRFKCLRCNILIIASSYKKHVNIGRHRGDGRGNSPCDECPHVLSRSDSLKRHKEGHARDRLRRKREMEALASGSSQGSMTPFSSVAVPTVPFTFPEPMPVRSMPSISPAPDMVNVQVQVAPLANSPASDTGSVQLPWTGAVTQSSDTPILEDLFEPVPGSSDTPTLEDLFEPVPGSSDTPTLEDLFEPVPGSSESSYTAADDNDHSAMFTDSAMLANLVKALSEAISTTA